MNVDTPVVTARKIKKSRLKQSTKNIYNDTLKNHFRIWLKKNANNVIVKKYKNVFKLSRRDEDGFVMNGKKYVQMMEHDDNILFEYIIMKRAIIMQ
jgi:hypothetical protein